MSQSTPARSPRRAAEFAALSLLALVPCLGASSCGDDVAADGSYEVSAQRGERRDNAHPAREHSHGGSGVPEAGRAGSGGGMTWTLPALFEAEAAPEQFARFYKDYCRVPKQGAETHDGFLVTLVSSAGIEANLTRWKGQFPGGRIVREEPLALTDQSLSGVLLEMEGPTYSMRGSLWAEGRPTPCVRSSPR